MQYRKKLKAEKLQALMKYCLKFVRQENLMTYFSDDAIQSINKKNWEMDEGCILLFPKKGTIYQPLRSGRIWHKVNF